MLTWPSLSPISVGRARLLFAIGRGSAAGGRNQHHHRQPHDRFDRMSISSVSFGGTGERRGRSLSVSARGRDESSSHLNVTRWPSNGAGNAADVEVLADHQQLTIRPRPPASRLKAPIYTDSITIPSMAWVPGTGALPAAATPRSSRGGP